MCFPTVRSEWVDGWNTRSTKRDNDGYIRNDIATTETVLINIPGHEVVWLTLQCIQAVKNHKLPLEKTNKHISRLKEWIVFYRTHAFIRPHYVAALRVTASSSLRLDTEHHKSSLLPRRSHLGQANPKKCLCCTWAKKTPKKPTNKEVPWNSSPVVSVSAFSTTSLHHVGGERLVPFVCVAGDDLLDGDVGSRHEPHQPN